MAFRSNVTNWSEVPEVMAPAQAGQVLGFSRGTVYRWIRNGEIDTVSTPSGPRVTKQTLMALCGVRPEYARPEIDPQVVVTLEKAQYLINEAMRMMEVR